MGLDKAAKELSLPAPDEIVSKVAYNYQKLYLYGYN